MASAGSIDDALQRASSAFGALQSEYGSAVSARQRLDEQRVENEHVQQEFKTLKEHNTVYKLVGPVLVQQDHAEARLTVDKRLEIIRSEISRAEVQIKELSGKMDAQKAEIAQLQGQKQQAAGAVVPTAA